MRFDPDFPTPINEQVTFPKWVSALWRMRQKDRLMYRDARFLVVDLPLKEGAAKKILPLMLRPAEPAMCTLILADYPEISGILPYQEALLLVRVKGPYGAGVHCPWIVVNDDTALVYGRELAGYPKKWADISFKQKGDTVLAGVSRRGTELIEARAHLSNTLKAGPVFEQKTYNVGGPFSSPWCLPIWCFKPLEIIKSSHEASVELKVRHSHYDPLAELMEDIPETLTGRVVLTDIRRVAYFLWAGAAGLGFFLKTYNLRHR